MITLALALVLTALGWLLYGLGFYVGAARGHEIARAPGAVLSDAAELLQGAGYGAIADDVRVVATRHAP